jgi:Ca2+-binding EF-hand superfamily protein
VEFDTSASTRTNRVQAAQLAFAKFDLDKSGTIDRAELGLLLAEWGISGVDEQLLDSFDKDGNGTFCFPEFVALFNSLGPETGSAGIEYRVAI